MEFTALYGRWHVYFLLYLSYSFPFYICFLILPGVGETFYFILRIRIVSCYFPAKNLQKKDTHSQTEKMERLSESNETGGNKKRKI
mgnify:FL=1